MFHERQSIDAAAFCSEQHACQHPTIIRIKALSSDPASLSDRTWKTLTLFAHQACFHKPHVILNKTLNIHSSDVLKSRTSVIYDRI